MTLKGFHECQDCQGRGYSEGGDWITMDGVMYGDSANTRQWEPCPSCSGVGVVPDPETVEVCKQAYQTGYWRTYDGPVRSMAEYEATRAALLAYAQHAKETK